MDILDQYTLRARLFPAILTVAPAFIFLVANFFVSYKDLGLSQVLITVAVAVLFFAFADFSRRFGLRAEKKIFASSGGRPFPTVLRHRDSVLDKKSKGRYHSFLEATLGEHAPSQHEENIDPENSDSFYIICGNWLRENTRDQTKFHVLFSENITYGFRRNLFGLKWFGLFLNIVTVCLSIFLIYKSKGVNFPQYGPVLLISAIHALYFLFGVSRSSVIDASNQYGRQLVLACETFMKEQNTKVPLSPTPTP